MEKVTIIETANAFFVKGLPQDLLGGKSVNRENIRVILDSDHDICGLYPLDKNHAQRHQESIEFTSSGDTVIGGRERAGSALRTHILALLKNSTEAGNLLRGNDALHAMLGARTRARMQSVLVTEMFTCLIARLLN